MLISKLKVGAKNVNIVELEAAKRIPRVDRIIGNAKREIIIAFGSENPQNYLPSLDAVKQAQSKGVRFMILQGVNVNLEGPSFKLLEKDIIKVASPLHASFVVVDEKDILLQGKTSLGNRLSGSYLCDKFLEVRRKFLSPIPSYT